MASSGHFGASNPLRGGAAQSSSGMGGGGASLDVIANDISKIGTSISNIDGMCKRIGTSRDSPDLRKRLRQERESTKLLSMSIKDRIRSAHVGPGDRQRFERIGRQYNSVLTRYENIVNHSLQKEREYAAAHGDGSAPTSYKSGGAASTSVGLPAELTGARDESEEQLKLTERAIAYENAEDIQQIERDLVDIQSMFVDMSKLVHEQGEEINTIEGNVAVAVGRAEEGTRELDEASRLNCKARKKKAICYILLAVLLGVGIYLLVRFVK